MKVIKTAIFVIVVAAIAMVVSYMLFGSIDWIGVAVSTFTFSVYAILEAIFGEDEIEIEIIDEGSEEGR